MTPEPGKWKMADGKIVAILDMEDGHLVNAVGMMVRNRRFKVYRHGSFNDKENELRAEAARRGLALYVDVPEDPVVEYEVDGVYLREKPIAKRPSHRKVSW